MRVMFGDFHVNPTCLSLITQHHYINSAINKSHYISQFFSNQVFICVAMP